jgi:hypothetical protein
MVRRIILYLPELLSIPVILGVLALVMLASLTYLFVTPHSVEMYPERTSVIANGVTPLDIPVVVKNKLGLPMPQTMVLFSSDNGYIEMPECQTNLKGICSVDFVPDKSLTEQSVEVVASAGAASDRLIITMKGDEAKTVFVELDSVTLPADGHSTTLVTAMAYDDVGNFVPDGSRVTFGIDPSGFGTFSQDSVCNIINGRCALTFTGSVNSGEGRITATSGAASASTRVVLVPLSPENIELRLSSEQVDADGEKTILVTVYVTDELDNPVSSLLVDIDAGLGTFDKYASTTDDSGACSFIYTAGETPGIDELTAVLRDFGLSSKRSVVLLPVSDLSVSMMAYENVGNPIIPAFARGVEFHGHDMARVQITNEGNSPFQGTLTLEVVDWSDQVAESLSIDVGETADITMSPPLKPEAYENLNSVPVSYLVVITDDEGEEVFRNTYSSTLAPYNTMVWGGMWDYMIAAWDTPNAPAIHDLVVEAAEYTPWDSITGYQEISGYTHKEITYFHMKAIYDVLKDRGMKYVNIPYSLEGTQTVYTPTQSLEVNGANCIDGSMVFASALTSIGMNPLIVLTNNHAFVCAQVWPDSDYIQCVETTMLATDSFADAAEYAGDQFDLYRNQPYFKTIDVNGAIEEGVKPLPA